jgi:hypothetical protein
MSYTIRDAIATEAKPLLGLYALSGHGKTFGALQVAKGFVGDMPKVCMIETEAGRGEAHAGDPVIGGYKVISLREDFSPKTYGGAIEAAEKGGFQALIIDSASHEWEGVGGVLAMAEEERGKGKKGQAVWARPKIEHSREFMLRLTQTPIPLVIVCMRAKYPMYEVTAKHLELWEAAGRPGGKPPKVGEWARSWQLEPKQSEDILSEMFVHGWIDEAHRFHGTKFTLDVLAQVFIEGEPLGIETGKRLAAWAAGRAVPGQFIDAAQQREIETQCKAVGVQVAEFLAAAKVSGLDQILSTRYDAAMNWLRKRTPTKGPDEAATLHEIDTAKDRDAAAEILDRCRSLPFHGRATEAFNNRWSTPA